MRVVFIAFCLSLLASVNYLQAQTSCLQNGQFTHGCPPGPYACETWSDSCGDGWVRSHGTPSMGTYNKDTIKGQPVVGYYVYMWSSVENNVVIGEGMFTPYLFQNNHTYEVKLKVYATSQHGKMNVYAANGLVKHTTGGGCGTPIPNVTKSLIGVSYGYTAGEVVLSFMFTNTSGIDFTQLWIYPEGVNVYQYDMSVKWVDVCPSCNNSTVNYNNGILPSGTTSAAFINAGSSAATGGAGIVTINSAANTILSASTEINLLNDFEATPTGSGQFVAEIIPCETGAARREIIDKGKIPLVPPVNDFPKKVLPSVSDKLMVYPAVSAGWVNISGDQKNLTDIEVAVFDLSGRKLLQLPKASYTGKATLNLGMLSNGVYLLQLKQHDKRTTQKIIIQK